LFFVRAKTPGREEKLSSKALPFSVPLVLLAAQSFCIGYFYNFVDTWSYYYFKEVRHLTEDQSILFTTVLQFAGAVVLPLGGWLSDLAAPRFGRRMPALLALGTAALLLGFSTIAGDPVAVLGLTAGAYGLVVGTEGVFWWAVLATAPDSAGSAYGFANAVGNAAQFLAPLALPAIASQWSWTAGVASVAAAVLFSSLLWNWALLRMKNEAM
jgi:sugar phosphate permease